MGTEKNSIKEHLILLAELQQADTEIAGIEKELAGVQRVLDGFEDQLTEMSSRAAEIDGIVAQLKKQYRLDESETRSIADHIAKTQSKLNAVKTNKEYQAMLKAIDDLKLKCSNLEDQMLAMLEQIETAENKKKSRLADFEDLKTDIAGKRAQITSKAEAQSEKIGRLLLDREAIWNQLPPKWQALFHRAVQQGRGIGVAPVIEAVCQACRVNLPPQLYIDLMRMNVMLLCPNCQRIIYPSTIWDNETPKKVRSE